MYFSLHCPLFKIRSIIITENKINGHQNDKLKQDIKKLDIKHQIQKSKKKKVPNKMIYEQYKALLATKI